MKSEHEAQPYRVTSDGYRWEVISEPGAAIHAEMLVMTPEIRRSLTAEGVGYLPAPNLERWKPYWNLPEKG
jgi:phage pi2 protein 07